MKQINGAELFLETLLDEGVHHIFGNPGTTELPLMDALGNEERLQFILCLQEAVAIAAAEGYALSTGEVSVINLHVAPGLGNAMGLLYNAKRSGAPVLVTAGKPAATWKFSGNYSLRESRQHGGATNKMGIRSSTRRRFRTGSPARY